jgi:hypothetical protein
MIYLPIDIQLRMIREDLEYVMSHICNHYPKMSWPCCPDCGDESCFQYSKCMKKCLDCEFARGLGLGLSTCNKHAPEMNMMISFPI